MRWKQNGKPARVFTEFRYSTKKTKKGSWDRERRVVAKAEHIDGKENPRFVVTSLRSERWAGQALYEELYCERGDMENRIKEQFSLFADRVSAETMRANQMRLYLSAMEYVLVSGLRRVGLKGTELAQAQVSTIRIKLLKIGADPGFRAQGLSFDGICVAPQRRSVHRRSVGGPRRTAIPAQLISSSSRGNCRSAPGSRRGPDNRR